MEVVDVKGDGSCFFRALYNAAREHGKLEELAACFAIPGDESCLDVVKGAAVPKREDSFVNCLRLALAQRIRLLDVSDAFYSHVRGLMRTDPETAQLIMQGFSASLRRMFGASFNKDEFRANMAESIMDHSHWVSEFEVKLIESVLNKCMHETPVFRVVFVHEGEEAELQGSDMYSRDGELVLVCVRELHYKYVRQEWANMDGMFGGRRRPLTRMQTHAKAKPQAKVAAAKTRTTAAKALSQQKTKPKTKPKPKQNPNAKATATAAKVTAHRKPITSTTTSTGKPK